ncbi:EF-hand domain-containing protein [Luteolibacter sp. GHJ8]|uniref:EF-hand domain-containing protein n=1 Tax=Luteolibacter rhizosphaerae TaxID=2989719 RepID=A0ABT3G356_9BACT|nr:EF-hand domain-containing protein [Luteolibacter rhizosphaerae]MCW1913974.1 EF-hand domain-containing protein [Luteolibacter rhizosphaerae]
MKAARYSWILLLALASARAEGTPRPDGTPESGKNKPAEKQDGKSKGPRGEGREGMRRMMEIWKKADTDGDGFISLAEFSAMERPSRLPEEKRAEIFKRIDKNSDGRISMEEIPKNGPRGMPHLDLEKADANKDKKIDFEEFKTLGFVSRMPEDKQKTMFQRMDTNNDGFLTPEDRPKRDARDGREGRGGRRPNLLDLVKDHDKDGNGSLSFEEFRQIPWISKSGEDEQEDRFEAFDKNKDLKIDAADEPPPGEKPGKGDKPEKQKQGKEKPEA